MPDARSMPKFRIATYNVEWFHSLFDDDGNMLRDGAWSSRYNVTREMQLNALMRVFREMDADLILIVEAPDHSSRRDGLGALRSFAKAAKIRASEPLIGFENGTQQELMILFDPSKIEARHDPLTIGAPGFQAEFEIDLDIDDAEDVVRFSKPPLELELNTPIGPLRMIGAHVKSKAPHGARSKSEAIRMAIANRRKQLAQCIWLRRRIEAHLTEGDQLIVLGDLNDGPGLDEYEALFGQSGVEIVLGAGEENSLFDPHAMQALHRRIGANPTTSRFFLRHQNRYLQALLDYIMVSPDLRNRADKWRILHPFDDPACWRNVELRDALLTASDHFPVLLDMN